MLLQFWATWCPHCQKAWEAMNRLREDYKKQGLVVFGVIRVTQRDTEEHIRTFTATNKLPYDVILPDPEGAAATAYEARGVPDTAVIDASGILRARQPGSNFPSSPEIRLAIETGLAALLRF